MILAVDVDPLQDMRIIAEYFEPLLAPATVGAFDAEGFGVSSVLASDGKILMYYVGLSMRIDVPWQCAIGLAASSDGLAFERVTTGPVLSTGPFDPFYVSVPFVQRSDTGFVMWYVSCTGWEETAEAREPTYTIRRTTSADGIVWSTASTRAIHDGANGVQVTRPWIASPGGRPMLWHSRRGTLFRSGGPESYRIAAAPLAPDRTRTSGAAESIVFGNPPVAGDWDHEMQAYACIVPYGDRLVMFYNGNDFGSKGFGWATTLG